MATNKKSVKNTGGKKAKATAAAEAGTPSNAAPATGAPVPNPAASQVPSGGGQPVFAQPQPSLDPKSFSKAVADKKARGLNQLEPLPPITAGLPVEPVLTLAQIYGTAGAAKEAAIQKAGQLVFHCVGDTGSVTGPGTQALVADKMVTDFDEANPADVPSFFFHLGDVVYYFGEATYYYDQFYEPFRNYPAPILAVPGNHDGVVYPNEASTSLSGFLANFCTATFEHSSDAGGLNRTTMIQPSVYFTFETPLVRIFGLYSNVLEDPGVISAQSGTSAANKVLDSRQVDFLTAALKRVKSDGFAGAIVFAVHHPPFTGGSEHGGRPADARRYGRGVHGRGSVAARRLLRPCAQLSEVYAHRERDADPLHRCRMRRP